MKNKKKILFATGASVAGATATPDASETIVPVDTAHPTPEELARRVNAWAEAGRIEPTQYTLFAKRVKAAPAVIDVKLDGNVLALAIIDGTTEYIRPDQGVELPGVTIVGNRTWWERCKNWVNEHKTVTISVAAAILLAIVLLIVKRK